MCNDRIEPENLKRKKKTIPDNHRKRISLNNFFCFLIRQSKVEETQQKLSDNRTTNKLTVRHSIKVHFSVVCVVQSERKNRSRPISQAETEKCEMWFISFYCSMRTQCIGDVDNNHPSICSECKSWRCLCLDTYDMIVWIFTRKRQKREKQQQQIQSADEY